MMRKYVSLSYQIQVTICDLMVSGVFERFSRLKLVSAENDVSWLPTFVNRMDRGYDRFSRCSGYAGADTSRMHRWRHIQVLRGGPVIKPAITRHQEFAIASAVDQK